MNHRPAYQFRNVSEAFTADGSWRDVYALNTTRDHWAAFLKMALGGPWPAELSVNGSPSRTPEDAIAVFAAEEGFAELQVTVGGAGLNCHFFTEREIELDLNPQDVGEHNFDALAHRADGP